MPSPNERFARYPLVIGHRGACGYRPEHTRASFELALQMGADAIETDLVPTRDGVLVCRHDVELSLTTDIADRPEFADRRTIKSVDGVSTEGWFVDDFTWEQIRTLCCRERFVFRDRSFDGQFPIMNLAELLELAIGKKSRTGQDVRVVLELKHPTYFKSAGIDVQTPLLETLDRHELTGKNSPVFVESFEVSILRALRERSAIQLVQLIDDAGRRPFDFVAASEPRTYRELISPEGLREIASYANVIGAWKRLIVPVDLMDDDAPAPMQSRLAPPTSLIADAHAAGLRVHAWTFRGEPQFLAADYAGDPRREYEQFQAVGLDGFITDFPDLARAVLG